MTKQDKREKNEELKNKKIIKKVNKNKKKNIKMDKYFIRRVTGIALIIAVIMLIVSIINFGRENIKKELSVLYNNESVKKVDGLVDENNKVYFSLNTVTELFDNNIYYNEAEKELITAYNKHVALLKVDEGYMVVNDSNIKLESKLKEVNDKVYLPLEELEIVYDIEVDYIKDENRVIIDSINKEKVEAKTTSKVNVKENIGFLKFAKVEKIEINSKVYIIEELEKYYKVRTENGNIGYIKKKKITDVNKIRDDFEIDKAKLNILEECSEIEKHDKFTKENDALNIVNPVIVYLDSDSKIATKAIVDTKDFKDYTSWADDNGIYVVPTLRNSGNVSDNLLTYAQRNKFINELYSFVLKNKLKGIYIDFENIDDINSFNRFLIELTPKFRESGLYVLVEDNNLIDENKIETIVDYVVKEK